MIHPHPKHDSSIRDRLRHVQASWTPAERLLRAIEGQHRREEFARLIAVHAHERSAVCAQRQNEHEFSR